VQEVVHEDRDVLAALAQRGTRMGSVQAEVEILAEAAGLDLLAQVQVGGGHHPHVHLAGLGATHPLDLAFCSARSACLARSSSRMPISSRNRVPPSARSEAAGPGGQRAGEAPFSTPKSSDSIRSSGMAAQLMATKGHRCGR
jgi:hypothetical protein